jgi:hypothetical protein
LPLCSKATANEKAMIVTSGYYTAIFHWIQALFPENSQLGQAMFKENSPKYTKKFFIINLSRRLLRQGSCCAGKLMYSTTATGDKSKFYKTQSLGRLY